MWFRPGPLHGGARQDISNFMAPALSKSKIKTNKVKKRKKKRLSFFNHHESNACEYFARGGVRCEKQRVRAPPSGRGGVN